MSTKQKTKSPLTGKKLGIIGGGNMAEALINGLLGAKVLAPSRIIVSEPLAARRRYLTRKFKVKTTNENSEAAACDIVLLAVKPQVMDAITGKLGALDKDTLVISIAAGVRLNRLKANLGGAAHYVRVMPNTPALIGSGISAYYAGNEVKPAERKMVETLLGAVGTVVRVKDEKQLDAVTGLSGSGPAYAYLTIQALAEGGVKMGLDPDLALQLAAETVVGAGKMVLEGEKTPAELIAAVSSKGGTTVAGLAELKRHKIADAFKAAVRAATKRAKEL